MFNKKCPRCSRKIEREYEFCPYCGNNIGRQRDKEDYGFLGKDDFISSQDFNNLGVNLPFGFGKLIPELMKQIDSQLRQIDKNQEKPQVKKTNAISISILTGTGKQPEIKISGIGPEFQQFKQQISQPAISKKTEISEDKAREIAKLPRKEAKTNVRRLSNKIIYEIELPGVPSLKDVLINKLENNIEIKAFSKNKVYFKLIPLSQLLSYKLDEEKLILEFKAK